MTVEDTPVNDDHTPHSEEDTCDIVDQSFHEHVAKLRKKRREKGLRIDLPVLSVAGIALGRRNWNPLAPMRGDQAVPAVRANRRRSGVTNLSTKCASSAMNCVSKHARSTALQTR